MYFFQTFPPLGSLRAGRQEEEDWLERRRTVSMEERGGHGDTSLEKRERHEEGKREDNMADTIKR